MFVGAFAVNARATLFFLGASVPFGGGRFAFGWGVVVEVFRGVLSEREEGRGVMLSLSEEGSRGCYAVSAVPSDWDVAIALPTSFPFVRPGPPLHAPCWRRFAFSLPFLCGR